MAERNLHQVPDDPSGTSPATGADHARPEPGGGPEADGPAGTGRCLCGAVTFATGPLRDVLNCHCHRCRRFTGHHMAATATPTSDLTVATGGDLVRWYAPDEDAAYAFCGRCGSSLFWRCAARPETTSICAGVLDVPTGLRTTTAWWVQEASDYATRPDITEHARE